MTQSMIARGRFLLEEIKERPRMFAQCREALLANVCGIIAMIDPEFDSGQFYEKHASGLQELVKNEWARKVIDDALALQVFKPANGWAPDCFGKCNDPKDPLCVGGMDITYLDAITGSHKRPPSRVKLTLSARPR